MSFKEIFIFYESTPALLKAHDRKVGALEDRAPGLPEKDVSHALESLLPASRNSSVRENSSSEVPTKYISATRFAPDSLLLDRSQPAFLDLQ